VRDVSLYVERRRAGVTGGAAAAGQRGNALALVVARIGRTGDPRWWLAAGAVAGLGTADNHQPGFFAVAVIVGAFLSGGRRLIFNRWFAAGAVIGVAFVVPDLWWRAQHGWATLAMTRELNPGERRPAQHPSVGDRRIRTVAAATALTTAPFAVLALPVLPPTGIGGRHQMDKTLAESVGWPELVDTVHSVWTSLPPGQQANAVIFTADYSEAAAINDSCGLANGY
jgi:4-amino-4-deoxy-L-arabinose transferase-like glycosyltransferase